MKIDSHLKMCKPIPASNQVLQSYGLSVADWPDFMEYQGCLAAPMTDFHTGNITAIACSDAIGSVSYAGGIRARQCGFFAGSSVVVDPLLAEFVGGERPLIFCTDLITSLLLHKITTLPVMFCTDISAFGFSGATDCYVRRLTSEAVDAALQACGTVDIWSPVGQIHHTKHVKWMDAVQAASLIEVSYG